jgi:hypothetical protein
MLCTGRFSGRALSIVICFTGGVVALAPWVIMALTWHTSERLGSTANVLANQMLLMAQVLRRLRRALVELVS